MKYYSFNASTSFEFEIKDLSAITQTKRRISGVPHRTDFYQIIWIESGESIQIIDFNPIKIVAGQLIFIAKNQVVSFDTSSSYCGQIILFTDIFFNRCDNDIFLMKQLHLFNPFANNTPIVINQELKNLWAMMKKEFHQQYDIFQSNLIHNYLNAFLIQGERQFSKNIIQIKNLKHKIALQFAELVEQHYKSLHKVNDYLEQMNITAKPLSKALQIAVGKTPKQFIDDRILLEAKRLLVYSNHSIKEITFSLGFEEPTNFSKFFREQSGLSPAEFKRQRMS